MEAAPPGGISTIKCLPDINTTWGPVWILPCRVTPNPILSASEIRLVQLAVRTYLDTNLRAWEIYSTGHYS